MSHKDQDLLETITPGQPAEGVLDSSAWFDGDHAEEQRSPIDEYLGNRAEITKFYSKAKIDGVYTPVLGSLVYLGLVSAVESYFRSLIRRLIVTDPVCAENASSRPLSYGAAVHHSKELLPEALFEGLSFASTKNVASELKSLCSISQMGKEGAVPKPLERLFGDFEVICQIRHCGIHRFGKLGSQQALKLGIGAHKALLEKPLRLTSEHVDAISSALDALVLAVNSYCFADIIKRTHTAGSWAPTGTRRYDVSWEGDWASDQERFKKYYDIFASSGKAQPSAPAQEVYEAFLKFVKANGSPNAAKSGAATKGPGTP